MAKPILVVRIQHDALDRCEEITKSVAINLQFEYHVLLVGEDIVEPKFEVYNVDKEPEIDYEELKKLLKL